MPKRLRYFLQRDADLQGAALRLFLRVVEQCLRAHSPGSGPAARLGAVAFIHRFGSTLNAHLHFHCVVIDGVFDSAAAGGVIFTAATGLDANAIAQVQAQVRRRLLRVFVRRGLLPRDDAFRAVMGQWRMGGTNRHRHEGSDSIHLFGLRCMKRAPIETPLRLPSRRGSLHLPSPGLLVPRQSSDNPIQLQTLSPRRSIARAWHTGIASFGIRALMKTTYGGAIPRVTKQPRYLGSSSRARRENFV